MLPRRGPALGAGPVAPSGADNRLLVRPLVTRLSGIRWLPILILGLGWGASRGVAQVLLPSDPTYLNVAYLANWVLGGAAGGLITGLVLRQVDPEFGWKSIWQVTGGWASAWALGWISLVTLERFSLDFGIEAQMTVLGLAGVMIAGALGGYLLGAAWRAAQPKLSARQVWLLAGGWAMSWILGLLLGSQAPSERGLSLAWSVVGLAAGLLGGALIVWQAGQVRAGEAAVTAARVPVTRLLEVSLSGLWLPIVFTAAGWGIARLLSSWLTFVGKTVLPTETFSNVLDFASWILGGALGGWLTGLALRRVEPSLNTKQLRRLLAAWAASWAIAWMLTLTIWMFVNDQGLEMAEYLPSTLSLVVGGALGGSLLAAIWKGFISGVNQRQVLLVASGWALGLASGNVLRYSILNALSGMDAGGLLGWAVGGAAAGLIGGAVMFWQFTTRRQTI